MKSSTSFQIWPIFPPKDFHFFYSSHFVRVFAADHGEPRLNSTVVNVTIAVIEKDSDIPMFEHPSYTFNVTEDTPVDSTIGHIRASQRNSPPGSSIVYEITSGNSEELFNVNQLVSQ